VAAGISSLHAATRRPARLLLCVTQVAARSVRGGVAGRRHRLGQPAQPVVGVAQAAARAADRLALEHGTLKIAGARYRLDTGTVELLGDAPPKALSATTPTAKK
jgi:hypothetical protein